MTMTVKLGANEETVEYPVGKNRKVRRTPL